MMRQFRRETGQDLVEFALILPLLAALLFGIMELGIVIFSYNTIADAAREGARKGAVLCSASKPACSANNALVLAAARGLTKGLNQANLTINQPAPSAGAIQVVVSYRVNLIPGIMHRPSITLSAASTMQTEQ
jgi:Flp pilus assembly protein TadG